MVLFPNRERKAKDAKSSKKKSSKKKKPAGK